MFTCNPETLNSLTGELTFEISRSGGPGGQNVNKVSTRVTALFDLEASKSLLPEQKARIREKLATRISTTGVLRVTSQRFRTQGQNREAAISRFLELIEQALQRSRPRRKTSVPTGAREGRRESKRRRSELKQQRKGVDDAW